MKLGKLPRRDDARTLKLGAYLQPGAGPLPALLPVPPGCDWVRSTTAWPLYRNDTVADCTVVATAHQILAWTTWTGAGAAVPEDAVVAAYLELAGGDEEAGAVQLDVLKRWRAQGLGGHSIEAFVAVDPRHADHVRAAIALFGGCILGLQLPRTAEHQAIWDTNAPTDDDAAAGSWGGHAVVALAYDAEGLTVITWGAPKRMTWAFLEAYADEAWAALSSDFLAGGAAPNGLDIAALRRDLAEVGS